MATRTLRRPDRRSGARSRVLGIIGVSVLGVIVLVLVVAALTSGHVSDEAGTTPGAAATAAPVDRGTPTADAPAEAVLVTAPPTRVLAAVDAQSAYRAGIAACPGAEPSVEITDDAGASWSAYAVSVQPAVASVRSITAGANAFVSLVTADAASCAPAYARSFVSGISWESADQVDTVWHVSQDGASVVAPGNASSTPCATPLQVAQRSATEASVLCADSSVINTTDAGANWGTPLAVPGVAAIAAGGAGYVAAIAHQNGCAGVQVVQLSAAADASTTSQAGACVPSGAAPQDNAIAQGGDTIWIWSGDAIARSADGGQTW